MNGAERLLSRHDPARTAIECAGVSISYGALREQVARAAVAWQTMGLQAGQPVAIKLTDGIDWAIAWLGAAWAGGVAVGVNPRIPAAEWRMVLDEAGFALIVAESVEDTPAPWRRTVIPLQHARQAWAGAEPIAAVQRSADDPVLWVHSSGSSGRPKAVIHSHGTLTRIARVSAERLGIGPEDRLLASSRLFFTYPLVNVLLAGLSIGATVLLDPEWPNAASFARTVARLRPSVLFSVPTLCRALLHEDQSGAIVRAGVRLCVSAGEALSPALRQRWHEATGLPMFDGYGCSETLVLVLGAADGEGWLQPSPGVRAWPLDPDAAAAAGPTRLLIECETLTLGYLDRPGDEAESFRGAALCPADLFVQQGHGWRFAGREDSLVKLRGRWVDLAVLEERLALGLPGLREAAAACVPDADGLDEVTLFYVADEPVDEAALRARLAERIALLPPHQRPARLERIDALPRTATGKLMRRQLAAQRRGVAA